MAAGHKQISNKVELAKSRFGLIAMAAPLTATLANQSGPLSSCPLPVSSFQFQIVELLRRGQDLQLQTVFSFCLSVANYKPHNCPICINTMWMWDWSWSWSWEQEQPVNRLTHYVIILLQRVIGRKLLPPNDKCISQTKRPECNAVGYYRLRHTLFDVSKTVTVYGLSYILLSFTSVILQSEVNMTINNINQILPSCFLTQTKQTKHPVYRK